MYAMHSGPGRPLAGNCDGRLFRAPGSCPCFREVGQTVSRARSDQSQQRWPGWVRAGVPGREGGMAIHREPQEPGGKAVVALMEETPAQSESDNTPNDELLSLPARGQGAVQQQPALENNSGLPSTPLPTQQPRAPSTTPAWPPRRTSLPRWPPSRDGPPLEVYVRVLARTVVYIQKRFSWGNLRLDVLSTNLLAVLGVILVNYGVESILDFYLGDDPLGAIACIMVGAFVIVYIRIRRVPVAVKLIQSFWN